MAAAKLAAILGKDAAGIDATAPLAQGRPSVDAVLLGKLVASTTSDKLGFLLQVYSKASTAGSDEYAEYLKKQAVAYAALLLLQPGQFSGAIAPSPGWGAQTVLGILKNDGSSRHSFPAGFLSALVSAMRIMSLPGYVGPEGTGTCLQSLLVSHQESVVPLLINDVTKLSLIDPFHGQFAALQEIGQNKGAMQAVTASPLWVTPLPLELGAGPAMEKQTLLGVFLRLSTIPETGRGMMGEPLPVRHPVGEACFAGMHRKNRQEVDIAVDSVRVQLHAAQDACTNFVRDLLKDKDHQDKMFDWVAAALRFSEARKMEGFGYYRTAATSSVGFLFNLFVVMLRLCKPFLSPDDKKSQKIDATWLLSDHRCALRTETRLVSSEEEVASWMDVRNEARIQQARQAASAGGSSPAAPKPEEEITISESFGTISEIFFLTLRAQQVLAPAKVVKEMHKLSEKLHEQYRALDALEHGSQERDEAEQQMSALLERRLGYDVVLADTLMLEDILALARLTTRWLLRVAEAPPSVLPLPPPPALFRCIPEFCMENVVDSLTLVAETNPSVLETLPVPMLHDFLNFVMAFSSSVGHIKNPYLRGKLLKVASFMIPRDRSQGFEFGGGNLATLFQEHEISRQNLVPTLIQFYIDVEVTGGHNQFYDKFTYRHYMATLLLYVCQYPPYLESVSAFVRGPKTQEIFVRFVSMMLNDAIYCIDESLLKLAEIRKAQQQVAAPDFASRPEEERREIEQVFQKLNSTSGHIVCQVINVGGGNARWGMQQLREVLEMMQMLTEHAPEPFLRDELVDRVSQMLNYLLDKIAGPKCIELKVQNPEKFSFKPKELLSLTSDIFLKLSAHAAFAPAVIRDGRSYNPQVLRKVVRLLSTHGLQDQAWLERLNGFVVSLEGLAADQMELDDALGEVPDEFQDPITADVMIDPVRLPTSGNVCDRKTIERHLLSDETDPFNRMRLTADMLEPDDELRARIEEWKLSRTSRR